MINVLIFLFVACGIFFMFLISPKLVAITLCLVAGYLLYKVLYDLLN